MAKWSQQAFEKTGVFDDPDRLRELLEETADPKQRASVEQRLEALEARARTQAEVDGLPPAEIVARIPR